MQSTSSYWTIAVEHRQAIGIGALVLLLLLFAVQNMAAVELRFLFWTFESRRIVVIAFSLIVGFVLGSIFGYSRRPKHPELASTSPKVDAT